MGYEVQQTRWDRIVRRITGSVGPGSRVAETIAELMPVLDVERVPPELLFLGGTRIVMGNCTVPAVPATFAYASVLNPVDSGNLIVVTQAQIYSTAADRIRISLTENVAPVAGTQAIRDGRAGVQGVAVGRCLIDNNLGPGGIEGQLRVLAATPVFWEDVNGIAVLPPGISLLLTTSAVNTGLEVNFMWRERPAEESELSL